VYELRAEVGNVNYRILYGFVGKDIAVLSSGLAKTKTVPASPDISYAVAAWLILAAGAASVLARLNVWLSARNAPFPP
jgi:hypothetical protein